MIIVEGKIDGSVVRNRVDFFLSKRVFECNYLIV